ncbi:hypothetical protein Gorai_016707, partial [Gossypium raimondii]|nr:hypothetical protein [Gossypium raimondii]
MGENKQFMKLNKSIIGDSLYNRVEEEEATLEDEDEIEEQDLQRNVDKYKVTFQPQYSTPKGPIVESPTRHAPSIEGLPIMNM